jgi:DNA invertase Pin-like site-specific DNA recombinase
VRGNVSMRGKNNGGMDIMTTNTESESWEKLLSARKVLRVAFYIRVSTSEQVSKENSLPAQKLALQEWCEQNNAVCAGVYADEGKTAAKEIRKRKEIHRMLADIREGKIDLVIFTRFDRFTRNPEEYFKVMETMNAAGVQWKAIMQKELDLNTDMGQTLILFYLGMGRQEIANISERIKATAQVRIQKGAPITGAHNLPISHTIGQDERGNKIVIPDPKYKHVIEAYIDHYETHQSKRAATKYCNDLFGLDVGYHTYEKVLKNTLMYGHYKGVDNYCEPYVTKERFESWAKIGKKNVRANPENRTYVFTQLCICGKCGRRMTSSYTTNRAGFDYHYYRCPSNKIDRICEMNYAIPERKLENILLERIKPEIERYISEYEIQVVQPVKRPKVDIVKKLEKELERLNYQFRKERISTEEYDKEYEELVKKISEAREREKQAENPEVKDLQPLRELLELDLMSLYKAFNSDEKRAFWRGIIDKIIINKDKTVDIIFL